MFAKFLYRLGFVACAALIVSCFIPWAYYPDIHKSFTGFYSEQNQYGKPGMFLLPVTVAIFIFMLLPKIWAKRANIFLACLQAGYAIKTYILFTSCYEIFCPEKRVGIYVMLGSVTLIMLSAIFPDIKLKQETV